MGRFESVACFADSSEARERMACARLATPVNPSKPTVVSPSVAALALRPRVLGKLSPGGLGIQKKMLESRNEPTISFRINKGLSNSDRATRSSASLGHRIPLLSRVRARRGRKKLPESRNEPTISFRISKLLSDFERAVARSRASEPVRTHYKRAVRGSGFGTEAGPLRSWMGAGIALSLFSAIVHNFFQNKAKKSNGINKTMQKWDKTNPMLGGGLPGVLTTYAIASAIAGRCSGRAVPSGFSSKQLDAPVVQERGVHGRSDVYYRSAGEGRMIFTAERVFEADALGYRGRI